MKKPQLSRNNSRPLYLQTRDHLLKLVQGKAPGETLPHERDLARDWEVSRITVRNAYAKLVEEGYVMKAHKAYLVAPRFPSTGLFMLDGFTKDSRERGNKPQTEVQGVEIIYPEDIIAQALLLSPRQRTYKLTRRRFLNENVVAIEHAFLSEERLPGLDSHPLESLYSILHKQYGIMIHRARQNLSFCFDRLPIHDTLGIEEGIPALHLKRVSYSVENSPIEYVDAYYNMGDLEFDLEIRQ